jgi:hypothetical protein
MHKVTTIEDKNIEISTIMPMFSTMYETCLFKINRVGVGPHSVVVDTYARQETAIAGHEAWVAKLSNPAMTPNEITALFSPSYED